MASALGRRLALLIYCLHELPDHKWNALYSLDFFLGSNQLSLETPVCELELCESGALDFCRRTSAHL